MLVQCLFSVTVVEKHYYLHLTKEQTKAQRVDVIFQLMADSNSRSGFLASPGTVFSIARHPLF